MNTVEDWINHLEISLGFKPGRTTIGDPHWDNRIYQSLCAGEAAFGSTATNFSEGMMAVIKRHNPDKYNQSLAGLGKSIEAKKEQGFPCIKVSAMYDRLAATEVD